MKALFFLFAVTTFILTSCGKFSDGSSVWQGGMWIIPVVLFLAAMYSFYRARKAYNSGGSWEWGNDPVTQGRKKIWSDKPANIWTIGAFWFGIMFTLATIGVIIWQNAEK